MPSSESFAGSSESSMEDSKQPDVGEEAPLEKRRPSQAISGSFTTRAESARAESGKALENTENSNLQNKVGGTERNEDTANKPCQVMGSGKRGWISERRDILKKKEEFERERKRELK